MKSISKRIIGLISVVVTSMIITTNTLAFDNNSNQTTAINNYYDVIANICGGTPKLYTEKTLTRDEIEQLYSSADGNWRQKECDGIYHLDLIDMDNDGVEELIVSYAKGEFSVASNTIEPDGTLYIYTMQNGKPLKIYEENKRCISGYGSGWDLGVSNINGNNYIIVSSYINEGGAAANYQIYKKQENSIRLECELHSLDYLYDNKIEYSEIVNGYAKSLNDAEFINIASKYMTYVGVGIGGTGYGSQPFFMPQYVLEKVTNIDSIVNNINTKSTSIRVILDGKELAFDAEPYIENGTTMVPMRAIFEALGAEVSYNAETKTITAVKGSTIIELVTGSNLAKINGSPQSLSVAVANKNGSTMIPLRYVSEALGAAVDWNGETKVVTITD